GIDNRLDFTDYDAPVSVNLQSRKATGALGGFANLTGVVGNGSASTLTAANRNNSWLLTGADSGTVADGTATFDFAAVGNLVGGASADFFGGAGSWGGSLNGGLGTNSLATDDSDHTWYVSRVGAGTLDGAPFVNFENILGGAGNDLFDFAPGG